MTKDDVLQIRIPKEEKAQWKKSAKDRKLSLSDWVRVHCNGEVQHGGERAGEIASTRKNTGHGLLPEDRRGFESPTSPNPIREAHHPAHHPRCTCYACKPPEVKKGKK